MGFSFYKHEYPTGRSNHTCEFCGELIKKGIKYSKEVGKYDGEFFAFSLLRPDGKDLVAEFKTEGRDKKHPPYVYIDAIEVIDRIAATGIFG